MSHEFVEEEDQGGSVRMAINYSNREPPLIAYSTQIAGRLGIIRWVKMIASNFSPDGATGDRASLPRYIWLKILCSNGFTVALLFPFATFAERADLPSDAIERSYSVSSVGPLRPGRCDAFRNTPSWIPRHVPDPPPSRGESCHRPVLRVRSLSGNSFRGAFYVAEIGRLCL